MVKPYLKQACLVFTLMVLKVTISQLSAQDLTYKVYSIGFYNVENLFDTLDNSQIRDEEFTPQGEKVWNTAKYNEKVANIASVISQLGKELCKEGVSLLGVSEVENDTVMASIVAHPILASRNYDYIHVNSKDSRGIDVALIYDKDVFEPISHKMYNARHKDSNRPTRDVLLVSGLLDGELIHVTVNHWPSRGGGEKLTSKFRNHAASVNRAILDSLLNEDPSSKLIVMGDLNDDPNNESVAKILGAEKKVKKVKDTEMYNPMHAFYDKGMGSNAFRDKWSLFDQIIISAPLVNGESEGLVFHKAKIYKKNFMIQKTGEFKGYPKRTFSGDVYQAGYSDHFPVYIYLKKQV
jgi:hypothetical protein